MAVTLADIEKIGASVIEGIIDHEGLINTVAGAAGILPQVLMAEKLLPLVAGLLQFGEAETGKGLLQIVQDFVSHVTKGQSNSPWLNGPNAVPAGSPPGE